MKRYSLSKRKRRSKRLRKQHKVKSIEEKSKRIRKQRKVKSYKEKSLRQTITPYTVKKRGKKRKREKMRKTPDVMLNKYIARMKNKFKEIDRTPIQVVRKRTIGEVYRRNMSPNLEKLRREFRGMVNDVNYVIKRDPEKVYVKAFDEYREYCEKVKIVLKPMSFKLWMRRNYNIEI